MKEEERKRKEKKRKEKKKISLWETERGKKKKSLQFSVLQRLEVNRPRIKVVLLDESYE